MIIIPLQKGIDWHKAPVVTALIIALNCLIYFAYQQGDNQRLENVSDLYLESGLFTMEYPIYSSYLHRTQQSALAENTEKAYKAKEFQPLATLMVMDLGFTRYLYERGSIFWNEEDLNQWRGLKADTDALVSQISAYRFGLIPKENTPLTFLSYQFLHGNLLHLFANMFFLLLLGITVEQAMGYSRYLAAYLLSGVCGGMLHCLVESNSYHPLIGASGAIAGLMGMYVSIYGFRKIQFVYFIIATFGRFKAPALWLLPIWVSAEVLQYFFSTDRSIAYWAHAGGMIGGALIIYAGKKWLPKLDETFLEDKDPHLAFRQELAKVMDYIGSMEFTSAKSKLKKLIKQYPRDLSLLDQLYKLEKLNTNAPGYQQTVGHIFCFPSHDTVQLQAIHSIYKDYKNNSTHLPLLDTKSLSAIIIKLCRLNLAADAEQEALLILSHAGSRNDPHTRKALNALAVCFDKQDDLNKANYYRELASAKQ